MALRLNQQNLNVSTQSINLDLNNMSTLSASSSQAESIRLASKLRKIKENLDNCYLNNSSHTATTTATATTTPIKESHTKSLNSTICSTNNLNDSFSTTNQNLNTSPARLFRSSFSNSNSNYSSTIDSSKYLLINHQQNFDFELNNNNTSLDHILDQFSDKLSSHQNSFNFEKNLLQTTTTTKNKSSRDQYHQSVVPIYNDSETSDNLFVVTNNSNNNSNNLNDHKIDQVSLKHAVYTENISRQSSIRSLITEKARNAKPPINGSSNNLANNFARVKQIKAKSQVMNNLNTDFSSFEKVEIDLLKDWDRFGDSTTTSSSNNNKQQKNSSNQRPHTRLGFQNDNDPTFSTSNNLEYSDNVTVASSSSSNGTNSKYNDFSEDCESLLVTPKSNKDYYFVNFDISGHSGNKQNGKSKQDNETESVLSDFVSNLKFDENKSQHSIHSPKLKEFHHDYDVNTTSDIYSDDNSISLAQNNNENGKNKALNSMNLSSVVIREKKVAQHKKLNGSVLVNDSPKTNLNNKNGQMNLNLADGANVNSKNSKTKINGNQKVKEDERDLNYKRLSTSINDLFANLINHLEKQKNKEFLIEDENENKFNTSNLSNSNLLFSKSLNQNNISINESNLHYLNEVSPVNNLKKNQTNSKDSNKDKDSGFNQESSSFYDSNSPFILKNQQQSINAPLKDANLNYSNSRLQSLDTGNPTLNTDSNELSLLERYLYNEQVIAEKHSKIENLIQSFLNEKNLMIDDYSVIEYILNQEGITLKTFKQLLREKFSNIDWPDDLICVLHQVINEVDSPIQISDYQGKESPYRSRRKLVDCRNESDIENNKLNHSHHGKNLIRHDTAEFSNSPASSSRSYRRIKEIKNSTNTKKKQVTQFVDNFEVISNQDSFNDHLEGEEQLKKTLSNSFAKRRERKGSLPEIVTNHMINSENNTFNNQTINDLQVSSYFSLGSGKTLIMNGHKNDNSMQQSKNVTVKSDAFFPNDTKRNSRKGAFVLEILRTSMFRSKSLTDLNTSLNKFDNTLLNSNNNQNSNFNFSSLYKNTNKSINVNLHQAHLNETRTDYLDNSVYLNSPKSSFTTTETYIGLIWQCADMCYPEYRNKYKELGWLLNGDNKSATSKLKEIDQRLKIELNLKEKNLNLIEDLNRNTDINNESSSDKSLRERLLNQLKLINDKIKEFEMIRLFLRICEINSHGLEAEDLNVFFRKHTETSFPIQNDLSHNQLQAKSFYEITKMLYGNDAICSGFVYQFFVTYRYMCSSIQLFKFFRENFIRASNCLELDRTKSNLIMERTIDLIAMWLDGFYTIDFQQNQELLSEIEKFLDNELRNYDENKYRIIYNLLHNPNIEFNLFAKKTNYFKKLKEKNKKLNQETSKKLNKIFNGAAIKRRILNNTNKRARSTSKSKSTERNSNNQDDFNSTISSTIRNDFFISDFTVDLVASQLTLLEWDNFLDIHVCHCLNSKAQGVNCDSKQPIDPNIINSQTCLFVDNYLSKSVYKMIQFNFLLTHWVASEILMQDTTKNQANLIMKFLKIAKKCYDWANFSSTFSIYEGLQDITIRNLPAWQHVSNKAIHILEKIASFKLLFQNDPFVIYNLTKSTNLPVIPSMHLFLLIVQQNEHGSFQLANGLWKWTKLGFLANLVDQIRNVQQHYVCNFEPCDDFVEDLLQRIYYLKDFDLNNLAESSFLDYQSQKLNSSISTIKNLIPLKKK